MKPDKLMATIWQQKRGELESTLPFGGPPGASVQLVRDTILGPAIDWKLVAKCGMGMEMRESTPACIAAIGAAAAGKVPAATSSLQTAERLAVWGGLLLTLNSVKVFSRVDLSNVALYWSRAVAARDATLERHIIETVALAGNRGMTVGHPHGKHDPIGAIVIEAMMRLTTTDVAPWPVESVASGTSVPWAKSTVEALHAGVSVDWSSIFATWCDVRLGDIRQGKVASWHPNVPYCLLPIEMYGVARALTRAGATAVIPDHALTAWRFEPATPEPGSDPMADVWLDLERAAMRLRPGVFP